MELNITWTEIREVNILPGRFYFVADIYKDGAVKNFCIAHNVSGLWWRVPGKTPTDFTVTHACIINKVTHVISPPAHAIGDRVIITISVEEYMKGSVGEIVGKYDKMRTWCIKMEDDFVILLEQKWFKRYLPVGK